MTDTGIFTRRIRNAGKRDGWTRPDGYVIIAICGVRYRAHRLAWFYVHGKWPDGPLDHIDGQPGNNKLSNLRQSTPSQNCWNRQGNIGTYGTVEEAQAAYDAAALRLRGPEWAIDWSRRLQRTFA